MNDFAVNLAQNKPARQSGTWANRVASLASDGRRDTSSCTEARMNPWWSVDLGAKYDVGGVTVTNTVHALVGNYRMVIDKLMLGLHKFYFDNFAMEFTYSV